MKNTWLSFLYILIPVAAALLASVFGNVFITLAAFILSSAILIYVFRSDVMMFVGTLKYSKSSEGGFKWMERAMKTGTMRPKNRLLYAYLLLRNGYLDEAENIINKTVFLGKHALKDLDFKTADFNMALIHWKKGNLNDAIMELEELYSAGFVNSALYGTLGYFYIANNETEKAIEFLKEGYLYNERDLVTADALGHAYIIMGMLDEAQELYDKIFAFNPEFIEPYYNYASLLEKKGELSDAKNYYQKALLYNEKYLSTITHADVNEAISRIDELLI